MNIKDILWLSYKDLSEKRVRTALTVIMVVIGVASIVALISQTEGISTSISTSLSSLGPTSIILTTTKSTGFTGVDIATLDTLPNVSSVIPILEGPISILANGQNSTATLVGVSSEGLQQLTGGVSLYQGSFYTDTLSPAVVVGYSIAFPSSLSGQQNIQIGQPLAVKFVGRNGASVTVPVAGILKEYGTSVIPIDSAVMLSVSEAEALLGRSSYNIVVVKATNTTSVAALSALITNIYGTSVRVTTTQQLLNTVNSIIGSITLLLGVVAGISLVVAAIGIMNVMLISVYERTHEIGIMKSLGFKRKHILTIFVFQAILIGAMGGVIGIVTGAGVSYGLSAVLGSSSSTPSTTASSSAASGRGGFTAGGGGFSGGAATGTAASSTTGTGFSSLSYQPVFTPEIILVALFVAIGVSIIAGIYPAWRASKMEPIDALRQL